MKTLGVIMIPIFLTFSCSSIPLGKGETKEVQFCESAPQKVGNLEIICSQFIEVFMSEYNPDLKREIHSSYPVFDLVLKRGGIEKKYSQLKYGHSVEFEGYQIKVTWSVVGTRDFKSHAKLKISRTESNNE